MTKDKFANGRKGGLKTAERHGRDHFVKIGKKGGQSRRKQCATPGCPNLGMKIKGTTCDACSPKTK